MQIYYSQGQRKGCYLHKHEHSYIHAVKMQNVACLSQICNRNSLRSNYPFCNSHDCLNTAVLFERSHLHCWRREPCFNLCFLSCFSQVTFLSVWQDHTSGQKLFIQWSGDTLFTVESNEAYGPLTSAVIALSMERMFKKSKCS